MTTVATAATDTDTVTTFSRATKGGIGALAGLCLALIKLVEVNFYIGQPSGVVLGGVLTMAAFVTLAAAWASCADETDVGKLFTNGLLAPSLLIALVHQGADAAQPRTNNVSIPTLNVTELFMPVVHAQERTTATSRVRTLRPGQFDGSVADGALMVLGRPQAQTSFVYVVGQTRDPKQATAAMQKVSAAEHQAGVSAAVHVVRAEATGDFYVTIGDFQTAAGAARTKQQVVDKVLSSRGVDPEALKLLVSGPVVDGRALVQE